jgi:hypothetical protein
MNDPEKVIPFKTTKNFEGAFEVEEEYVERKRRYGSLAEYKSLTTPSVNSIGCLKCSTMK